VIGTRSAGDTVWSVMNRAVAIGLAFALAGCGSQPDATPTPATRPSVAADVRDRAQEAVDAFLTAMADPGVTYRATGQLRAGAEDAEGRPDVLVNTYYDVKGSEYGGTAHLYSENAMATASMDVPGSLRRPDALQGLNADDLAVIGETDDGLLEFAVTPWLGGDPLGEWSDLDAVPDEALPPTELRWHDTRLFLDEEGVPHRLRSSWLFVTDGSEDSVSGTIVEEFTGLGMFVKLAVPEDFPVETSHNVIVGVDADHVIITEPWVDILADGGTATLDVVYPPADRPIVLGIEGAIYFVRSTDADGELILDAIVGHDDGTIEIPVGEQTLVAYYRTCDGNCALLDEAQDFCEISADVVEGARYELTVEVHGPLRATCTLGGPNS
jgi:hypothetical protein